MIPITRKKDYFHLMCSVTFPFINSSSELAAEITLAVSGFKAGKNPFISRHSLSLGHDPMTFYLPYTTNYNLTNTALCLFSITNTIHFEHYCLANSHILTNFNGTKLDNPGRMSAWWCGDKSLALLWFVEQTLSMINGAQMGELTSPSHPFVKNYSRNIIYKCHVMLSICFLKFVFFSDWIKSAMPMGARRASM